MRGESLWQKLNRNKMEVDQVKERKKWAHLPEEQSLDIQYIPPIQEPSTPEPYPTDSDLFQGNQDHDVRTTQENRYHGVIYAGRFFVTRVGFLRSAKRIMVLSSNHLTIVDPYTDEVKEQYPFEAIKEITAPPNNTSGTDATFTLYVGKSVKDTYSCRTREELLTAYYQLRERASSMKRKPIEADDNNPSGMYFDSLFTLCGKSFNLQKWSATRSTTSTPVYVDVVLAVRATSLDRLDPATKSTLSSIPMSKLTKIQRVTQNSEELLLFYENNIVQRYFCTQREPFIQAIGNNMRSWLSVSLFVQDVEDASDFDALTTTRDIPQPVLFEMPVYKISKDETKRLQLRLLGLTSSGIIERDPKTYRQLALYSLSDIYNIVIYPSVSSAGDEKEETNDTAGKIGKFALELKSGRTRRYLSVTSTVGERSRDNGTKMMHVENHHVNDLHKVIRDIQDPSASEKDYPDWLKIEGSTTILGPKESRNLFIANLIEFYRMNKMHVSWSTRETPVACKEGTWGTEPNIEWEDILLRKLSSLTMIPNLVSEDGLDQTYHQLEQFNHNIPLGSLKQKDRRAFSALMKLLENFKDYSVSQVKSLSNSDAPVPNAHFQVSLLQAIQRLVCIRGIFEEVSYSQYKNSVSIIAELVHSPIEEVSFAAAFVFKYMTINYADVRGTKAEQSNRRAIYTRSNCNFLVSRAFDVKLSSKSYQYFSSSSDKYLAKTITSTMAGLDYLVIPILLQSLEVCLSSGKKSTPERVGRELLNAMRIEDFPRHHTLFQMNHSLAYSIAKCSSVLVKVHVLEQPSELVEIIQDFARVNGTLIWQLYLSLCAQDKAQRRISSQLVALLTHENPRTSNIIRNIFPHSMLDDLPAHDLQFDEFGRALPSVYNETRSEDMLDSDVNRTLALNFSSRVQIAKNTKCAVLLPEFFEKLSQSYSTKDLMWGPPAVSELVKKIEHELAILQIYRLKHQYYILSNPMPKGHWNLLRSAKSKFHKFNAETTMLNMLLKHRLERTSSNKFLMFLPASFSTVTNNSPPSDDENDDDDDDDDSEEDHSKSNQLGANIPEQEKIRKAKRLKKLPYWFVGWNGLEFYVDYKCYQDEVKVGRYYLANILNDHGVLSENLEDVNTFLILLYYRVIAEGNSDRPDSDTVDIRLLCIKVMVQVYERYSSQIKSLVFLNHLLEISLGGDSRSEHDTWPLIIRGNIVLFLDRVLNSAVNVARFLKDYKNLTMIINLLQEVKPLVLLSSADSGPDYVTNVDYESGSEHSDSISDNESLEFDVAENNSELNSDSTEKPSESKEAASEAAPDTSESDSEVQPTNSNNDISRHFTVVAEAMSPSVIMQTCLSILSRLVECHTSEEEGGLVIERGFDTYKGAMMEGIGVSPIARIKRELCQKDVIRFLVSLLDSPNRAVFKMCLSLIRALVRHNEPIIPTLEDTGLFFYLLRFSSNVEEMTMAAKLMSKIHLRQASLASPEFIEENRKKKKSLTSPDPLTKICMKSYLVRLLPVSMVAQLLRHSPEAFAKSMFDDANNPEVIWNEKMRNQMIEKIEEYMNQHMDSNGVFDCYIDGSGERMSIQPIEYPKEVHSLQCYQYYLHNLLDEERFPEWPIYDEASFLMALMESINKWNHPSDDQSVISVRDLILLLESVGLLIKRFPDSIAIQNLKNFSYVLESLDKIITEFSANIFNPTSDSSKYYIQAFVSAINVINLAVGKYEKNAMVCSSVLGVRVLCESLRIIDHFRHESRVPEELNMNYTTNSVLNSLVCVLGQTNGRVSAATQSIDLLPSITEYLIDYSDLNATELATKIVYEMAESCGEMAEVLLLQLAEHGIIWYISKLMFEVFDQTGGAHGDEVNDHKFRVSLRAAKTIHQIMRAQAKEDSIAGYVLRMQSTIEKIFTPSLIELLHHSGSLCFHDIVTSEVRKPHIMWTRSMRKELLALADKAIQFHKQASSATGEKHKVYELPFDFEYSERKAELCVAGIYVNFFNNNPQEGIEDEIPEYAGSIYESSQSSFTHDSITEEKKGNISMDVFNGLLQSFYNDLAGVRAQSIQIEDVFEQRMLPVITALRNMLQYVPGTDSEAVASDSIPIFFSIFDHEALPNAYSFSSTPFLQLRVIECLHIMVFSSKAVDSMAVLVPPYVKCLFNIVYSYYVNDEDSVEGMLGRITAQFLGNLCLIPGCIDNLVKGMDPRALARLLPQIWLDNPQDVQLLLCLHMIPLKRHTQAATEFTKEAIDSQLVDALLSLMSVLAPKEEGNYAPTKSYAARFLSILSSNPGSGGAISSILISSQVWDNHMDAAVGTSDELRHLLVVPEAPALLACEDSNPHRVGKP